MSENRQYVTAVYSGRDLAPDRGKLPPKKYYFYLIILNISSYSPHFKTAKYNRAFCKDS
jgi:hypothetical protein